MFNSTAAPSLADIAAVTGNDRNGSSWGDGNGWWVLIILFAIFGGWGNGTWGGNGNNGGYVATAATQADIQRGFDNNAVMNKLDTLSASLCNQGYEQLAQMNNLGLNVIQSANGLQSQICQGFNGVTAGQAQTRYDMAMGFCNVQNSINNAAQNIMQNDNANYRNLHDEIIAIQLSAKNDKIAELQSQIQALNTAAVNANQTNDIVNQLRPPINPTYLVQNPYAAASTAYNPATCTCGVA